MSQIRDDDLGKFNNMGVFWALQSCQWESSMIIPLIAIVAISIRNHFFFRYVCICTGYGIIRSLYAFANMLTGLSEYHH